MIPALVSVVGVFVSPFRLRPDSYFYAAGNVAPHDSILAGLAGRAGGMSELVVISALAAGGCILLAKRRWLAIALCGPWLLFPGADAIGALAAMLCVGRSSRGGRAALLPLVALAHPVALAVAGPATIFRRRSLATASAIVLLLLVVVAFAIDGEGGGVSTAAHVLYMTRYFVPLILISLCGVRAVPSVRWASDGLRQSQPKEVAR